MSVHIKLHILCQKCLGTKKQRYNFLKRKTGELLLNQLREGLQSPGIFIKLMTVYPLTTNLVKAKIQISNFIATMQKIWLNTQLSEN